MTSVITAKSRASLILGQLIQDLSQLVKFRLGLLVLLSTVFGYYLATVNQPFSFVVMINTVIGTWLLAGGSSVFNQWLEKDFDRLMNRTSDRPLPAGRRADWEVIPLATLLFVGGMLWLGLLVNFQVMVLGVASFVSYIVIYTPLKRKTVLNTWVGALPGALPPVMGWAASGQGLDLGALYIFLVLYLWQIPHFLAIAIIYEPDYRQAGFAMLPSRVSQATTKKVMLVFSALLLITSLLAHWVGDFGFIFYGGAVALGLGFLWVNVRIPSQLSRSGPSRVESLDSVKISFYYSILYLPLLFLILLIDMWF